MSNQEYCEPKLPRPEEVDKLRDELHMLQQEGPLDYLDEGMIERICLLPPSLFYEAIRNLVLTAGPLASFPDVRSQPTAVVAHDQSKPQQPSLTADDGASFLDSALASLTSYNKLLEEKVAKFSVQSTRSVSTLKESAASDHDVTALNERIADVKLHTSLHVQQINALKASLDSRDKSHSQRLENLNTSFWNELLLLRCDDTFFDKQRHSELDKATLDNIWDEYDHILGHVERWRSLVNDDSDGGEGTIARARQHVNQLVYSITRHCQVQLATVFHESLAGHSAKSDRNRVVHEEAADIIKEIDWLWEEVIPVAHMSVSAQYLGPVLAQFKDWNDSQNSRETMISTYASGVLKFMNDRLLAVSQRTQILIHHHQALCAVSRVRRLEETDSTEMDPINMPGALVKNARPKHEHAVAAENLRTFMQIYGAASIHDDDPLRKPTTSLLDEHVQNRAHKGDTILQDLQKHFEAAAQSGLADHEVSSASLLDSLLADSAVDPRQLGSVYKDAQLEGSIEMLQAQTSHIQEMFKGLQLGGPESAPDYVTHAYKQTLGRQEAKDSGRRPNGGENPDPASMDRIRDTKFEDFVQKWQGC